MIRVRWIDEVCRLLKVDGLVKCAMKKGALDVELMDGPCVRGRDAEDDPYGGRLDHRAEGLVVVDAMLLGEAANDPTSFVTSKGTIGVVFVLEHPLARDHIGAGGSWNKGPSAVVDEGLIFVGHSRTPIGIGQGAAVVTRQGRCRSVDGGEVQLLDWPGHTFLGTCDHVVGPGAGRARADGTTGSAGGRAMRAGAGGVPEVEGGGDGLEPRVAPGDGCSTSKDGATVLGERCRAASCSELGAASGNCCSTSAGDGATAERVSVMGTTIGSSSARRKSREDVGVDGLQAAKEKIVSSKMMWREIIIFLVAISRQR